MSAATALRIETTPPRLMNEGIPLWRLVRTIALGAGRSVIVAQPIPAYQAWEFAPGDVVETMIRPTSDGLTRAAPAAVVLATA
jgi:hypothetical protein